MTIEKIQIIAPNDDDSVLAPRQPQNGSQLQIEPEIGSEIKVEPEKMDAAANETVIDETVTGEAPPAAELLPSQPPASQPPSSPKPILRKGLRIGLRPGM